MIRPEQLASIAAAANLAPSVHNTQPTRWRLGDDGALWLLADTTRRLKVGDPTGRDLRVSVGAALEATTLALRAICLAPGRIDLLPAGDAPLAEIARLELTAADPVPLPTAVQTRTTWRKGFAPAPITLTEALDRWSATAPDLTVLHGETQLAEISALNERTSLAFYRAAPYREELLGWLRLSAADPRFGQDGLSWPALGMSGFEALGARFALRQPMFGLLDAAGLIPALITEHKRTMSAAAVLLFHRPAEEDPVDTGRALYRRLLALAELGLQAWPMSVLADDPETRAELSARHAIPADRRLITAWRVGPLPAGASPRRERLPADQLTA